jgi:NADPH2:quinone reductase
MRAVICKAFGEPETLIVEEVPDLAPGDGEIRIAVAAAGVNFADILMVGGGYQESPDFPFTPGLEVAGTVLDRGAGVTGFAPGDRVMAGCAQGGFAEQAIVPAGDAYRLPDGMGFDLAGGFPVAYGTAYGALAWRARLQPGETLLVLGAAGGVGLTAVEVGKAMGATVIAAAGGPRRCALAQDHGADHVIDYAAEDLRERVREITGKAGCNVIFDPVGGDIFDTALRCLAWEGRLIVIGFASGRIPKAPANILLVKNCGVLGFYWGAYRRREPMRFRAAFDELLAWYGDGRLKPHVSMTLPLERAGEALCLLRDRRSTGKVVLAVELIVR